MDEPDVFVPGCVTSRKSSSASSESRACDAHQTPTKERGDAVREPKHLLIVGGHEDDREPLVRKLAQVAVNLRPCADIDSTRGFFDKKDRRLDA